LRRVCLQTESFRQVNLKTFKNLAILNIYYLEQIGYMDVELTCLDSWCFW